MSSETSTKARRQIGVGGLEIDARGREHVAQVLESNRLSYGPFSQRFEQEFADAHDCRHALFCSSGTAALIMAIGALKEIHGWRDGDEVLVPATTFIATSNAVIHNGLRPVFVEVDSRTYNMDPARIESRITERTRAILPVHLMGLAADMTPIMEIAGRRGLLVVEDSCETMFSKVDGKSVGSIGNAGCFSTYVAHFIVAGIGGFATTNDDQLATVMRSIMNHGRDSSYISIDDDQGLEGEELQEIVAKRFSFVRLGHNFRATELEAAIGLAEFEKRGTIIEARRQIAQYYTEALKDLEGELQLPTAPPGQEHMYMLYPLVVKNATKTALVNYLEQHGIETRDLMPLLSAPITVRLFGDLEPEFPISRWIDRSGFYIGCHQELTVEEQEYVVSTIHDFFKA